MWDICKEMYMYHLTGEYFTLNTKGANKANCSTFTVKHVARQAFSQQKTPRMGWKCTIDPVCLLKMVQHYNLGECVVIQMR